ncbi:UDP-glucuronic acid decarboxylase 1-like [Pollicipes pollicipes]|uniref:UDP-glucuronic acid decarboxylase 1-like n=1 Tax=Pollicipes pollicipes TaxID=41117 RepID=UPI001884A75C|nr:UDP-glucuronic acid decarboxylase 1-like [Pollicipes pollicipes]
MDGHGRLRREREGAERGRAERLPTLTDRLREWSPAIAAVLAVLLALSIFSRPSQVASLTVGQRPVPVLFASWLDQTCPARPPAGRIQTAPPAHYGDDCEASGIDSHQQTECRKNLIELCRSHIQAVTEKMYTLDKKLTARYPPVKFRSYKDRKRILVTGGAGFVGSHLVDRLMLDGHEVTVVDNFFTGRKRNIETWLGHHNFEMVTHDIVNQYYAEVDEIYHLASPASPPHYMANPVKTIKTNAIGTINMLGLAKRVGARILIASTSEIYGDPEVHPQPETYWGNVNPIGPRACYDEGKRVAETLGFAYMHRNNVSVRIARIFNTYGPRMHNNDGRVVSNFILQALENKKLTIYGSGKQTRSFQYVSDLVEGLVALMESEHAVPVNIGNPDEHTIEEFASIIQKTVGRTSGVEYQEAKEDDPQRRRPDISRAKKLLNWEPKVPLAEGIKKTVEFFRQELQRTHHDHRNTYDPLIDWAHIIA